MKQSYLFFYGKRLLTEVIAESEEEARRKVSTETWVTISKNRDETPVEYRHYLRHATVKIIPLPEGFDPSNIV